MNLSRIQPVVDAVLYEGYILYPYRADATKNRQRWTFGGIYPRLWHEATDGAEPYRMQTQCLIEGDADTRLEVRVRFLQPVQRDVGVLDRDAGGGTIHETDFHPVASLSVDGRRYHSWQEAVERDVSVSACRLGDLLQHDRSIRFAFDAQCSLEPLTDARGEVVAALRRVGATLRGSVRLAVEPLQPALYRIGVTIENTSSIDVACIDSREQASLYAFASTHTLLALQGGSFVSLLDPPARLQTAALACVNQGTWPVLAGVAPARDMLLSSPIILYDYPQVAAHSPGDLYDATEIDEILSLNILAMSDAEKQAMAATDARAAALLARTESLDGDAFMRLHGTLQTLPHADGARPARADDGLQVGDHVRLHPGANGDILDLVLDGRTAVIESIERDFEDRVHVAVTLDDDPGRDWGLERMPGHRFFFSPAELEALDAPPGAAP